MKRIFSLPLIGLVALFMISGYLATAQTKFTVQVTGKGSPLILIHGLACTGEVWKETLSRYENQFECHTLTVTGFGGSPSNLTENFLESVKQEIIDYAKNKKLKSPTIIGHSMGGFLALWAAADAPDLFKGIIAVDGIPYFPKLQMPGITPEAAKEIAGNMKTMMEKQTPDEIRASQKMYLPSMISDQKNIDLVVEMAAKSHAPTLAQVMYEMYTIDLTEKVANIKCPVLVMGAWVAYKMYGVTRESAVAGYTAQIKNIKGATLEMSDTAKHFIFYDDPTWFFEKTDNFLQAKIK